MTITRAPPPSNANSRPSALVNCANRSRLLNRGTLTTELIAKINDIAARLGTDLDQRVTTLLDDQRQATQAAAEVGVSQFANPGLTAIGSDPWRSFLSHAFAFAKYQDTPSNPYPQDGSVCILCHQTLSPAARDLLVRARKFLVHDAQTRLVQREQAVRNAITSLQAMRLDVLRPDTVSYRMLHKNKPTALAECASFLDSCVRRRDAIVRTLSGMATDAPTLRPRPTTLLGDFQLTLKARLQTLRKVQRDDPTPRLLAEQRRHEHRVRLAENLPAIRKHVERLRWADRASEHVITTHHVTLKHGELFTELVTDRYVELFQRTLDSLGRHVTVSVVTSGRKGDAYKQIRLKFDADDDEDGPDIESVLSEGEKRVVALADFLTEVALDSGSAGIVLDDPVTSLDLEWRETIARIVADESRHRQVIVFTHDLPFVWHLRNATDRGTVDARFHWIVRGGNPVRPGLVLLDNCPTLEGAYRKTTRARELHSESLSLAGSALEMKLRDGFGALRTSYEAFVIFELLGGVVTRFSERISVGRLKDVVVDPGIRDDAIGKFENLSRFIEGHLHSDEFAGVKPTPTLLLTEIEYLEALKKRLRDVRSGKT